eukprot:350494-Chlamydomonas_euryale.AAC.9
MGRPTSGWIVNCCTLSNRPHHHAPGHRWYHDNAEGVWGNSGNAPSEVETRVHAKCLRSVDAVRCYFRRYRKTKAKRPRRGRGRGFCADSDDSFQEDSSGDERNGQQGETDKECTARPIRSSKQRSSMVVRISAQQVQNHMCRADEATADPAAAGMTSTATTEAATTTNNSRACVSESNDTNQVAVVSGVAPRSSGRLLPGIMSVPSRQSFTGDGQQEAMQGELPGGNRCSEQIVKTNGKQALEPTNVFVKEEPGMLPTRMCPAAQPGQLESYLTVSGSHMSTMSLAASASHLADVYQLSSQHHLDMRPCMQGMDHNSDHASPGILECGQKQHVCGANGIPVLPSVKVQHSRKDGAYGFSPMHAPHDTVSPLAKFIDAILDDAESIDLVHLLSETPARTGGLSPFAKLHQRGLSPFAKPQNYCLSPFGRSRHGGLTPFTKAQPSGLSPFAKAQQCGLSPCAKAQHFRPPCCPVSDAAHTRCAPIGRVASESTQTINYSTQHAVTFSITHGYQPQLLEHDQIPVVQNAPQQKQHCQLCAGSAEAAWPQLSFIEDVPAVVANSPLLLAFNSPASTPRSGDAHMGSMPATMPDAQCSGHVPAYNFQPRPWTSVVQP